MKPFEQAELPQSEIEKTIDDTMRAWREGKPDAVAMVPALDDAAARAFLRSALNDLRKNETIWRNDRYQVNRRDLPASDRWPAMIHLSIRRLDRETIHDWRDLQEIKNLLIGPENEAVELYPAESRRVDTANQYHLFVLADASHQFPFGFDTRLVQNSTFGQAKQRPL
jgi:hypothetical protein